MFYRKIFDEYEYFWVKVQTSVFVKVLVPSGSNPTGEVAVCYLIADIACDSSTPSSSDSPG
jgi:hypothetical protein